MALQQSNSKRLAKNTFYMYIRMFVMLIVSLYTSRVVLRVLGVEDFGIYNVVGSLVAMFSSLRGLFSASTQRFLSYEMGVGNNESLNTIFNMSIVINIVISIIFFISAEIVGYIFFKNGLNIEGSRFFAAQIVFQLSLMSAVISLITTSFDALIIAHEKMSFFAYVAIFDCILRLILVLFLSIIPFDKLILYGILQTSVTLIIMLINIYFCRRKFNECYLSKKWDNFYFKKMFRFAGWCFLGNTSYAFAQNGINMVLNVFGGPVVNAARGIAYQIKGVMDNLVNNIVIVIKPYCIKKYAEGDSEKLVFSLIFSGKLIYSALFVITVPLYFFTYNLLSLWLGSVPEYSINFVQLILLHCIVRSFHPTIDTIYMAIGDLKKYQICEGVVLFLPVIFSYLLLSIGIHYNIVFFLLIIFEIVNTVLITVFLNHKIDFPIKKFLVRTFGTSIFPLILLYYSYQLSTQFSTPIAVLSIIAANYLFFFIYAYFLFFTKSEITMIESIIRQYVKKHNIINQL